MFRPPVIFVAITTFFLSTLRSFNHFPITISVAPSRAALPSEGMGYCSAVSKRLTPFSKIAVSMNLKQAASSGALKSDETQRWVPSPSSETIMSEPPRRLCFIPLTVRIMSFVFPLDKFLEAVLAGSDFPAKKPPKSEEAKSVRRDELDIKFMEAEVAPSHL